MIVAISGLGEPALCVWLSFPEDESSFLALHNGKVAATWRKRETPFEVKTATFVHVNVMLPWFRKINYNARFVIPFPNYLAFVRPRGDAEMRKQTKRTI